MLYALLQEKGSAVQSGHLHVRPLPSPALILLEILSLLQPEGQCQLQRGSAGLALRAGQHAELAADRVAERPRVLYNNATRSFVMWCHVDEADYELARVGIAVSPTPQVLTFQSLNPRSCKSMGGKRVPIKV